MPDKALAGRSAERVRAAYGPQPTGRLFGEALDALYAADLLGSMLHRHPGDIRGALRAWEAQLRPHMSYYQVNARSTVRGGTPPADPGGRCGQPARGNVIASTWWHECYRHPVHRRLNASARADADTIANGRERSRRCGHRLRAVSRDAGTVQSVAGLAHLGRVLPLPGPALLGAPP